MPGQTTTIVEDALIHPLSQVLSRVGQSIADAQKALDSNSIATQTLIDNDPVLSESGLEATWYHMPEVEVQLKMSLAIQHKDTVITEGDKRKIVLRKKQVYAAPFNAGYQNTFNADVEGASQLKAKIVSIPPPKRPTEQ